MLFPVSDLLQKEKMEQQGSGGCLELAWVPAEGWMLCCVCTCSGGLHWAADLHGAQIHSLQIWEAVLWSIFKILPFNNLFPWVFFWFSGLIFLQSFLFSTVFSMVQLFGFFPAAASSCSLCWLALNVSEGKGIWPSLKFYFFLLVIQSFYWFSTNHSCSFFSVSSSLVFKLVCLNLAAHNKWLYLTKLFSWLCSFIFPFHQYYWITLWEDNIGQCQPSLI